MLKNIFRKLSCNDKGQAYIGFECTFEKIDEFERGENELNNRIWLQFQQVLCLVILKTCGPKQKHKSYPCLLDLFIF